jgi:hypothetical protein
MSIPASSWSLMAALVATSQISVRCVALIFRW